MNSIDIIDVNFDDICELVDEVVDKVFASDDDCYDIAIVGLYPEVKEIIGELVLREIDIDEVHLYPDEEYGFFVHISNDEGDISFTCTPLRQTQLGEDRYTYDFADETYIIENCKTSVVQYCAADRLYNAIIEDIDVGHACEECDTECDKPCCKKNGSDNVEITTTNEEDVHGFTVQQSDGGTYRSFSYYTTDELSRKDIDDILRNAGF